MTDNEKWNDEEPILRHGVEVPGWIDDDISPCTVASIVQGGCASGAYMPAVTYWQARETMNEHGDAVLQYIQDSLGELPKPKDDESWSGIACFYLSIAVELWAGLADSELDSHDCEGCQSQPRPHFQ